MFLLSIVFKVRYRYELPNRAKEISNNGKFGELVEIGDYSQISRIIQNFKKIYDK